MGTDGIPKALVPTAVALPSTYLSLDIRTKSPVLNSTRFGIIQQRCEKPQTREDGTAGAIRVYAGRDCYVWPGPSSDSGGAERFSSHGVKGAMSRKISGQLARENVHLRLLGCHHNCVCRAPALGE